MPIRKSTLEKISVYPTLLPRFSSHKRTVLVGGCFDLLHYGHLCFLKAAKAMADYLIIALESDQSISRSKGNPPIHTHQQRAEILAELTCTDHILLLPPLQDYTDYLQLVQDIHPNFLAVTQGDPQTDNKRLQAETVSGKVVEVNTLIEGLSSSIIRAQHL